MYTFYGLVIVDDVMKYTYFKFSIIVTITAMRARFLLYYYKLFIKESKMFVNCPSSLRFIHRFM